MSAEAGSSQPTAPNNDKQQQAQKPPASFSSFIIKDKSTRKFAPKAIQRRRPGATQASQPTAVDSPSADTATPEPHPFNQNVESFQANSELTLSAPSDVQEQSSIGSEVVQQAPQTILKPTEQSIIPTIATSAPTDQAAVSPPPSQSAHTSQKVQENTEVSRLSPARAPTPPSTDGEKGERRSPKRRRIESPQPTGVPSLAEPSIAAITPAATPASLPSSAPSPQIPPQSSKAHPDQPPEQHLAQDATQAAASAEAAVPSVTSTSLVHDSDADLSQLADSGSTDSQRTGQRRKRQLPWTAINDIREDAVESIPAAAPVKLSAKAKGKRKEATAPVTEDSAVEPEASTPSLSAKARGKRKATIIDTVENHEEPAQGTIEARPKKPRKVRKDKGTTRKRKEVPTQDSEQGDAEYAPEEGQPKRKRARKKSTTVGLSEEAVEGESGAENEDGTRTKKPRGRRRAETPEDAEDREIDPNECFMEDIASRNPRFGKISQRERNMREINWEEVRQRRREQQLALAASGGTNQDEVNELLDKAGNERAAAAESGPKFREVDGQIVIIQESTIIDHNANAARDVENLEQVEEDDLTTRITTQSWILANRRDPADRVVTGRGRRWAAQETEAFYDALGMFGTDFQMISTLFPGRTRHNVKQKFVREEREDPNRIKSALAGERQTDFSQYLQLAGMDANEFLDPRELERELKEVDEQNRALIEEARKEYEEEQRQRQLAGVDDSEAEGEGGDKENQGRKKKKKKEKRPKHMPVGGEEAEIVGTIDDDEPAW